MINGHVSFPIRSVFQISVGRECGGDFHSLVMIHLVRANRIRALQAPYQFQHARRMVMAKGWRTITISEELYEAVKEEVANRGIAWTPTLAQAPTFASLAESFNRPKVAAWIKQCMDRLKESKLLRKAVEMNVTILAGTDMMTPGSIPNEIMALHEFGLDTTSAIAAATSAARAYLDRPSLDEGGPADFVLYDEDPRVNLEVIRSPNLIVAGGQKAVAGSK